MTKALAETPPMNFRVQIDARPATEAYKRILDAMEELLAYLENPAFDVIRLPEEEK